MALTLEPAIKPAAPTRNLSHEDFVDQLDRVDPAQTPMTSFCSNAVELKSTDRKWLVDTFPDPKGAVGRGDGEAAATGSIRSWTANMRPVGNIGQGFDEQFGIGWIAQTIPQIAGVTDPLAYAKASAYLMLKQHMEVAFTSFDQAAIIDGGSGLGSLGSGYLKLTDYANRYTAASSFALGKPSDVHYAPTGACVTGALSSVHNRALWKTIAYALRVSAKRRTDWTLIAGLTLRQAITDLTDPAQATTISTAASSLATTTGTQVKIFTRAEDDNVLGATVDIIVTDYGRIMVTDTDYMGTTKTSSAGTAITNVDAAASARALSTYISNPKNGVLLKKGNVFKVWGIPPFTEELGKDGGGPRYDAKAFAMFGVKNPTLAGWLNLT
jgi:hypothetical protein